VLSRASKRSYHPERCPRLEHGGGFPTRNEERLQESALVRFISFETDVRLPRMKAGEHHARPGFLNTAARPEKPAGCGIFEQRLDLLPFDVNALNGMPCGRVGPALERRYPRVGFDSSPQNTVMRVERGLSGWKETILLSYNATRMELRLFMRSSSPF